ncbi:hypothetical protein MRX96_030647 [Rhipicephalus microplus]
MADRASPNLPSCASSPPLPVARVFLPQVYLENAIIAPRRGIAATTLRHVVLIWDPASRNGGRPRPCGRRRESQSSRSVSRQLGGARTPAISLGGAPRCSAAGLG